MDLRDLFGIEHPDHPGTHGRCAESPAGRGGVRGRRLGSIPAGMLDAAALTPS